MGVTHLPNGFSAQQNSVESSNLGEGGIGARYVIGDIISALVTFGTSSAAQVQAVSIPNFACNLVGAIVTVGSVSAVSAAYTVQGGSAGTVHVSSEANTNTDSYSQQALTIDSAALTTTGGLQVTRGTQGTAGDSGLLLLFKRTAE